MSTIFASHCTREYKMYVKKFLRHFLAVDTMVPAEMCKTAPIAFNANNAAEGANVNNAVILFRHENFTSADLRCLIRSVNVFLYK